MDDKKVRLDVLIFEKGLTESREKAKKMILESSVYVNNKQAFKPGALYGCNSKIEIKNDKNKYVSRGGLKLEKALNEFNVSVENLNCMDIGASTGGFTDCLLKNGCNLVYAIDVGHSQLDESLRSNKRVINLEQTNVRYIEPNTLKHEINFFTVDVSFISLKLVLPVIKKIVKTNACGICLIKPQFEAGKENLNKRGVVKNKIVHQKVLKDLLKFFLEHDFSVLNLSYSPIKGPAGNIEYLIYVQKSLNPILNHKIDILEVIKKSHEELKNNSNHRKNN